MLRLSFKLLLMIFNCFNVIGVKLYLKFKENSREKNIFYRLPLLIFIQLEWIDWKRESSVGFFLFFGKICLIWLTLLGALMSFFENRTAKARCFLYTSTKKLRALPSGFIGDKYLAVTFTTNAFIIQTVQQSDLLLMHTFHFSFISM